MLITPCTDRVQEWFRTLRQSYEGRWFVNTFTLYMLDLAAGTAWAKDRMIAKVNCAFQGRFA